MFQEIRRVVARWFVLIAVVMAGCNIGGNRTDSESSRQGHFASSHDQRYGFQTYVGDGFTMLIPADASVIQELWPDVLSELTGTPIDSTEPRDTIVVIEGPELRVAGANDDVVPKVGKPSYRIAINVHQNPDNLALLEFARQQCEADVPYGVPSADSMAAISKLFSLPVLDSAAGQPVAWYWGYSPDALVVNHFFARGDRVVEFEYILEHLYAPHLVGMQEMLYAHVIESLRWQ